MFDAVSYAEIDGQHAELLPARTVLSLFSTGEHGGNSASACSGNGNVSGGLIALPIVNALNGVNLLAACNASAG